MSKQYSHLIDLNDYPVEWWNKVISLGASIYAHPQRYVQACAGKIMAICTSAALCAGMCRKDHGDAVL